MTISAEIKLKVFAQYLGQMVEIDNYGSKGHPRKLIGVGGWDDKEYITLRLGKAGKSQVVNSFHLDEPRFKLILKSLSAIKDEDAIEIAKICDRKDYGSGEYRAGSGKDIVRNIDKEAGLKYHVSPQQIAVSIQYLILKGYDIPQHLLAGKTLYEAGLAIYE